jgi:hypothetical protein
MRLVPLRRLGLLFAMVAPVTGGEAEPALDPGTFVVDAKAPLVAARIAGQPVRLRFDLAAHAPIVLAPEAVARLGLAGNFRNGKKVRVSRGTLVTQAGRLRVKVPYSTETVAVDGRAHDVRVAMPEGFQAVGADGLIGPKGLPYMAVRLELGPATSGNRTIRLPLEPGGAFAGLYTRMPAVEQVLEVEVAPSRPFTHGTASTGGALTIIRGGRLSGPVREVELSYGIRRPARLLTLDSPWSAAGLPVTQLLMRVQDWEGKVPRPADADSDPDAILVLVQRDPQRAVRLLTLGADVVGRCASFEWRRAEDQMILRCP